MICPHCRSETSDMLTHCEFCGANLYAEEAGTSAVPPPPVQGPGSEPPPGAVYPEGYPGYEAPVGASVSEWPPPTQAPMGRPPAVRPGAGEPWYLRPWPYVTGIIIVAIAIGAFLLLKGGTKAYPDLVVNGQPTLLDFYTDS